MSGVTAETAPPDDHVLGFYVRAAQARALRTHALRRFDLAPTAPRVVRRAIVHGLHRPRRPDVGVVLGGRS